LRLERILKDESAPAQGRVSLVDAGPGDPELLTLKAHRKLQEADVIVHDRTVSPTVLELCRRDAVRVAVGKTSIADLLVREAKAGKHVVYLKQAFGRAGEEQAALEVAGIPLDVVPGVTAASACEGLEPAKASADIVPFPVREDIRAAALRAAS
jgi:uroporphyrin-III C-methyltransferase/precorrin-2 dehydrogenase/sirohydrochlorin ferrochelatase